MFGLVGGGFLSWGALHSPSPSCAEAQSTSPASGRGDVIVLSSPACGRGGITSVMTERGLHGGLKISGGKVSLPASSPFERFCFVVVFARWPKALCRNAAICAEICGKSIFPYLFNTAITQGSLLQRRTLSWRGLLGLKCAGVIIAPGTYPRLPGTLATSTNIRRRCTWFWQI